MQESEPSKGYCESVVLLKKAPEEEGVRRCVAKEKYNEA
jgi:hypothetical protein